MMRVNEGNGRDRREDRNKQSLCFRCFPACSLCFFLIVGWLGGVVDFPYKGLFLSMSHTADRMSHIQGNGREGLMDDNKNPNGVGCLCE